MPTPGSHAYDLERSRLRSRLENEGLADEEAEARAGRILDGDPARNPAAGTDRAAGPLGGSGGEGDPGAVMQLRSPSFSDNTRLPRRCSRDGGNVSPALEWSPPPDGTEELVLLCEDRDTPAGFVHWLVGGIDPATTGVGEGESIPRSMSWPNGFGERGWGGPQPPVGDDAHRYFFRLFALARLLGLGPDTPADTVRKAVEDDHLATGTLVGLYAL